MTTLGLAGLHLSLAEPARACSCVGGRTPADLASNQAAALVTRTTSTPDGVVEVLHASKKFVQAQISGPDNKSGCGPEVGIDSITAVALVREDDDWAVQTCGYLDQDATFAALLGKPKATATGLPVAWLAGGFGGARAGAVNAAGEVVAWAEPGQGSQIAVCPGSRRVVTAGFAVRKPGDYVGAGPVEVVVHDATTLRTIRRVTLPKVRDTYAADLRCADPAGRRIDVLVRIGENAADLVTITGDRQRRTSLTGPLTASTAVRDGFVIAVGEYRKGTLLHLLADGSLRKLPSFKGIGIDDVVADPSGRRVVVDGYGDEERPVWTVDLRTGKTLGRQDDGEYQAALVWPTADRILINGSAGSEQAPFQVFDARLRPQGTFTPVVGTGYSRLAGVDEQLAFYGASARFAVQDLTGTRFRVTEELRLAGAEGLAAAPDRSFDLPSAGTQSPEVPGPAAVKSEPRPTGQAIDPSLVRSEQDTTGTIAWSAVVGSTIALTLGGALACLRRRRTG